MIDDEDGKRIHISKKIIVIISYVIILLTIVVYEGTAATLIVTLINLMGNECIEDVPAAGRLSKFETTTKIGMPIRTTAFFLLHLPSSFY